MPNTAEAPRSDAVFDTGLRALGSGGFRLFFIDQEEVRDWVRAASKHGFAATMVDAVDQFLRGLQISRPPSEPPLCLTCDSRFGRGALPPIVGLVVPLATEAANAAGFGFCRSCASRAGWRAPGWQGRLAELATPQFRKIWADFRVEDGFFEVDLETGFPRPAGNA